MTEIFRGGGLVVWFHERGDGISTGRTDKATFMGQHLYPGGGEYEYFFQVDPDELQRALDADGDLTEAVLARAEEIVTTGESKWLQAHNVTYYFSSC